MKANKHAVTTLFIGVLMSIAIAGAGPAVAEEATAGCQTIYRAIATITGSTLYEKLGKAMTDGAALHKGLPLRQWGVIVDRTGVVCAVVTSGGLGNFNLDLQWLGSRVIAAQKANTVNDFSTSGLALSTANLYAATQPGGSLFGLQFSNPVDTTAAYGDNSDCSKVGCDTANISMTPPPYGQPSDPLVGHYIGGVNAFGGGLALYDASGDLIGGLGTSGNTSCADHYISWVVRYELGLDHVPAGVADGGKDDNIIFDMTGSHGNFASKSGFGQPLCGIDPDEANYPAELEKDYPIGH
jgi:hypothetical protein